MSRIFDTFMFRDELDVLEARLYELENVPNLVHIAVEADVDHQDHPKPYVLSDSLDRFAPWKERLYVVQAKNLPTIGENPDPWSREHAQREWSGCALVALDAADDDIVLHGDLDEIPRDVVVRNVRPRGGAFAFEMRCYSMAVDWQHPEWWNGTVATSAGKISRFAEVRSQRNTASRIPDAGWHLGWLGGQTEQMNKLDSFCHPEIERRTRAGIEDNAWLEQGWHVDGKKLIPVDVDGSWPRWVHERRCPENWFRPRDVTPSDWRPPTGRA